MAIHKCLLAVLFFKILPARYLLREAQNRKTFAQLTTYLSTNRPCLCHIKNEIYYCPHTSSFLFFPLLIPQSIRRKSKMMAHLFCLPKPGEFCCHTRQIYLSTLTRSGQIAELKKLIWWRGKNKFPRMRFWRRAIWFPSLFTTLTFLLKEIKCRGIDKKLQARFPLSFCYQVYCRR